VSPSLGGIEPSVRPVSVQYPVLLLQLPQLHVLDALLLVRLLDERDLLQTLGPLKEVDLERDG